MSSLKLSLLGQPRFERDGRPLQLDTRQSLALAAYLALTKRRHSRAALIALLWSGLDPARAGAELQRNLSALGQALGGEWLVVDGDEIGTDPGADLDLDVDRFRYLLSVCQTHGHPEAEVCPQCLVALTEAAELYRGDLLEGLGPGDSPAFDEWRLLEAEGLRRELAAALEKLARGHGARGEWVARHLSPAASSDADPPALPTGTVAFLFTDIEGSTPLWEQKPGAMRAAVARHHAILRQAIEAHGGIVFKVVGDAFQAAFDLALQGLSAALAAQRALRAEAWGETGPLRVRMGLHAGPAELDGADYAVSHTLNRVARVMSAGHGGQILLSQEAADLVWRDLPPGVSLRDMGEHHLKGMLYLEHLYQVAAPDLPPDFPPLATLDRHHNLPIQTTPFVGRAALLAQLEERLSDPACRMLTLVGPGGSGKTRLALETAARQVERYSHGAFFVPLAPLRSVESILPTIAQALGFPLSGEREPKEQLLGYLQGKSMLLILDNWEHLLDGAGLAAEILAAAPEVKIVSTSRTRLNVQAEHAYPIEGMDFPALEGEGLDNPQEAARYSAVKLFLTAARRTQPGYELTNDNLGGIIRICHLVEGMPLGILLAASWVQVLPAAEIADQIAHGLDFLEAELSDVPERHRSMRAVLDHSWALLTAREREAIEGLSVFQGEFARQAAQQVTGVSLPELRALANKSLLHLQPSGRYHVHELVRQYAAERLARSPAASERVHSSHCAWYMSALQGWMAGLTSSRQQEVLAEMDAEIEDARAAWERGVAQLMISQLAPALDGLCAYYQQRGRFEEGQTACQSLIDRLQDATSVGEVTVSPVLPETPPGARARQHLLAKALTWKAVFTGWTGHTGPACLLLEQSLALLKALESAGQDVRAARAFALLEMGGQALDLDRARAGRCLEQSLDLYRALDDRWGVAHALDRLGSVADGSGRYDRAREMLSESLAIRQAVGDRRGTAHSLTLLGLNALRVGQLERGEDLLRQSVALLREMGERVDLANGLHLLGFAAFLQGRFEQGIALQEECLAIAEDLGLGHPRGMALQALATYHAMLGHYEQARAYATTGLAHARALGDGYVAGVTCLVLGCLSLVREEYAAARDWFEQSLAANREMAQPDGQSWSLACLGYAVQGLGDLAQARQYLYDALRIGVEANAFLPVLIALSGIALLRARTGDVERAVELWAMLSRYPSVTNAPFLHQVAGRHIDAAAAALPPEAAAAARERGLSRDLGAVSMALLAELGMH